MNYLIDTHIFIWFFTGSKLFSSTAKELILNPNNKIFISIASLWEVSIKTSIGKLDIERGYEDVIDDLIKNSIEILPITFDHTVENNKLPFHHRDPFDRIIVAQAIVENMDFISADAIFDEYLKGKSVARIW